MNEKVLVLSGHYPVSHWQAHTNHKIFSGLLGFDYIHAAHATSAKDPYMHKINWVSEYLNLYDYVFWIDDDSYFLDFQSEDAQYLMSAPVGFFLASRTELQGVPIPPINSAFFGLRATPKAFELLSLTRRITENEVSANWSIGDGHRYGGDQDRLWAAFKKLELDKSNDLELVYNLSLNGRFQDLAKPKMKSAMKILHLTGKSNKKWKKLRKAVRVLETGNGLVPSFALSNYPSLQRGQHRIIASRMADHPGLHPISKLIPRKLLLALGGK